MATVKDVHIEAYDYPLPEARIAKYQLPRRDAAKLLLYHRRGDCDYGGGLSACKLVYRPYNYQGDPFDRI